MALYKRGSVWWVRFTTPGGNEIRETAATADRRQAQEYHDRRKAEFWRISQLGERPRHTWQDAVVRWLEANPGHSHRSEIAVIFRQIDPLLGALYLDQIDTDIISRVTAAFRVGIRVKTLKPLSINSKLSAVRAILRAAVGWGWIDRAPAIPKIPVVDRRLRWLTREEADRLIAELPPHVAAMARFSLATGLREKNVCGLEWSQIDMDRRIAWIHADQSKTRRVISIPLNGDALVVLREQQGQHPRYVFTWRGRPLARANRNAWQAAIVRTGLTGVRWHDLRHTWASWHVQAGTPLLALKELGGWSSIDMVMRYAHLAPDHLAEHAERISVPRLVRTNSGTAADKSAASK